MSSSKKIQGKKSSTPAVVAHHQVWPVNRVNPAYMNMSQVAHFNSMSSIALANSEAFSQIENHTMKEKHIKSSDSESSDDCLIPQKCKRNGATKIAMFRKNRKCHSKNMGPEGYRASAIKKVLDGYPKFSFQDEVAWMERNECSKCKVHVGRIALLPCGHAKFCCKCINTMRDAAIKRQSPGRCLSKDCLCVVESWFVLKNVNH